MKKASDMLPKPWGLDDARRAYKGEISSNIWCIAVRLGSRIIVSRKVRRAV